MKKFILLLLICITIPLSATAKVVKVQAVTAFDSNNPPKNFKIKLKDNIVNEQVSFFKGMTMSGYIYQTIPPKRLKQDASFIFIPTKYTDLQGASHPLTNIVCKYTTKIKPKEAITNALYVFGSVPVMAVTAGYYATEGAKNNKQNGNKTDTLKASAENVYDNSPLSLIEKGDYLKIKPNQEFLLNFVIIKQQEPNYEYKQGT